MVVNQPSGEKSNNMTRFIDYYFMCGLKNSEEPKLYKHFEEVVSPGSKEKKLISSVLCHFPNNNPDNPWNSAELWKLCTPGGLSVYTGQTQPSKKPHFHSFVITREDASKTFGHVLTFYEVCVDPEQKKKIENCMQLEFLYPDQQIFIQKCIGFITQLPLINTCEKVLRNLYGMFVVKPSQASQTNTIGAGNNLPIESYIYNLLYEVPQLTPGCSLKVSCMGHDDPVIVHLPGINDLPFLDIYLSEMYRLLGGAQNVVNLLTSVLYEHQILLVSETSHKLSLVGEGITALLFPFQWQHTYVSVLPYELASHFFDAPVPYIIGVVVVSGEKQLIREAIDVNQCYVDLDKAVVESPEDQPCFPNQSELIQRIQHFKEAYDKEMSRFTKTEKDNNVSTLSNAGLISTNNNTISAHATNIATSSRLQANETVSRVTDIARKVGVLNSLEEINSLHAKVSDTLNIGHKLQVSPQVLCEQKFNIALRETLTAAFLSIFFQYDKFVINPILDEAGSWTFSSETQDNFDKTSFLSDQPESTLPFLYSFFDTQMFASFIDNAIIAHQNNDSDAKDLYLRLFDEKIEQAKILPDPKSPGIIDPSTPPSIFRSFSVSSSQTISSPSIESWIRDAELAVEKRLSLVDLVSCLPHPVHKSVTDDLSNLTILQVPGSFPIIRGHLLESGAFETKKHHLKRRDNSRNAFKKQPSIRESKWRMLQEARSKLLRQPSMSEYSPELIAQTNWMFVEKLLKDVKNKTKKILVGKMGQEAIELGHDELSVSDLEENTWIASLCDLLERVWSHGLLTDYKKGKSALWSHLLQYQAEEEERMRRKHFQQHYGGSSPSLLSNVIGDDSKVNSTFDPSTSYYSLPRSFPRKRAALKPSSKQNSEDRTYVETTASSTQQSIPLLDYTILASMERIQAMREVQTEVGRSRAWIRLALEQKQLHSYLRELLSNHRLLDLMYKKYSLLQCEDEREQFLYHLLSLNAADFHCFTNSFSKTTIEYQVWVVPGRKLAGASQTSANVYMWISGEQCRTDRITVPRGCLEFSFKHQNLGIITTLTIGHDNAGILPKWLLDDVIVQNKVTGQTCCFSCRRWLGKGVDDNSLERLLVAEIVPRKMNVMKFANTLAPSTKNSSVNATIPELQELVGQAVNSIVKYYYKPVRERSLDRSPPPASFTILLFKLVKALEKVFTHGPKTGRFLKRRLFALDVVAATFESFRDNLKPVIQSSRSNHLHASSPSHTVTAGGDWFLGSRRSSAIGLGSDRRPKDSYDSRRDANDVIKSDACLAKERKATARLCQLYQQICSSNQQRLGKDDIFFLLMFIGIQEHSLALWLPKMSEVARNRHDMYDDSAFLCDVSAVVFLGQVLNMLQDYEIPLDPSLLRDNGDIIAL